MTFSLFTLLLKFICWTVLQVLNIIKKYLTFFSEAEECIYNRIFFNFVSVYFGCIVIWLLLKSGKIYKTWIISKLLFFIIKIAKHIC